MRQSEKRESWLVLLPQDISLKGRETSPTSRFDAVGFFSRCHLDKANKRGREKEKEVVETVTAVRRRERKREKKKETASVLVRGGRVQSQSDMEMKNKKKNQGRALM